MRIVQVVHWFLPKHTAGTEIYTVQLSQELAKRHEVFVYCREEDGSERRFGEREEVYQGLPIHRVHFNPPSGPLHTPWKAWTRFRNPWIERSFARYLQRVKPDVVHFQHLFKLSGGLIRVAQALGIPTVVTLHDYWMICYSGQLLGPDHRVCLGPLGGLRCARCAQVPLAGAARTLLDPVLTPLMVYRTWSLRRALLNADAIISPSAHLARVFERHGLPPGRILVADNGTEVGWARNVQHVPSPRVRFGYIGTVAPHKGVHVLMEAFRGLDPERAELHIYGGTDAFPDYARELQQQDVTEVTWHGPFQHERLAGILSQLDILVIPSIWPENSPVTIHEARAARLPVLAAEIGGMTELVQEGMAGWCFPPDNAVALRAKMQWLVEHPHELERVRETIRPVKTIQGQARELEALYRILQGF